MRFSLVTVGVKSHLITAVVFHYLHLFFFSFSCSTMRHIALSRICKNIIEHYRILARYSNTFYI